MNQILYKGYTFGGVGEDVTNKQHTITLDGQELETIGGENSEVFNNYKDQDINIAEGNNSTVIGRDNKELKYIKQNGQYVRSEQNLYSNFISGSRNLLLGGHYNTILGDSNSSTGGGWGNLIAGASQHLDSYAECCTMLGEGNRIEVVETTHPYYLPQHSLISGKYNTGENPYQVHIFGFRNKSTNDSFSFIAGVDNITNNNYSDYYGGAFVLGSKNSVSNTLCTFVAGTQNIVDGDYYNTVLGKGNTLTHGENSFICGEDNTVSGTFNFFAGGYHNTVSGSSYQSIVYGYYNQVGGEGGAGAYYGSAVIGYNNRVGDVGFGTMVFGDNNEVDYNSIYGNSHGSTYRAIIYGKGNKAYHSHQSLFGGYYNTGSMTSGIFTGEGNILGNGWYSLVCAKNLQANNVNNSICMAEEGKLKGNLESAIVCGDAIYLDGECSDSIINVGSLEAGTVDYSIINGSSIKLGHRTNMYGIGPEEGGYMDKYTTEDVDFSSVLNGYVIKIELTQLATEYNSRYYISKQEYYARSNSHTWRKVQDPSLYGEYLGTTTGGIYDGCTYDTLEMIVSATYNADSGTSYYGSRQGDRKQRINPENFSLAGEYVYNNGQWELDTPINIYTAYSTYNSIIQGSNIKTNGNFNYSQLFGYGHEVDGGEYSFITGRSNNIKNYYGLGEGSRVLGAYNTINSGSDITIIGNSNTVRYGANWSTIIGTNNLDENGSYEALVLGKDNLLTSGAPYNSIFGKNNIIINGSAYNFLIGADNIVTDGVFDSLIFGFNNTISQSNVDRGHDIIIGINNLSNNSADLNTLIGYNNLAKNSVKFSTLIGYGLTSEQQQKGSVILGRYNDRLSQYPEQFIIGNGYIDNGTIVKQNSFVIEDNGKITSNINNAVYGNFSTNLTRTEFTDNYIGISLESPYISGDTIEIATGTLEDFQLGNYTIVTWTKGATFDAANHTFTDYSSVYFTTEKLIRRLDSLPTIGTHYWQPNTSAEYSVGRMWKQISSYLDFSISRTTAPTIEAKNIVDYNSNQYYIKGVNEANNYITTNTTIETNSNITNGLQSIKFDNATIDSGLGIGEVQVTPNKVKFISYNLNSNDEKETVEFTFEDLKLVKQISQLPNLDNNSYPISV